MKASFSKWVAGVAAGASALSTMAPSAHAYWTGPTYTVSGRIPSTDTNTTSPSGGGNTSYINRPVGGTVDTEFTWVPTSSQPLPPDDVYVELTGYATWNVPPTPLMPQPMGIRTPSVQNASFRPNQKARVHKVQVTGGAYGMAINGLGHQQTITYSNPNGQRGTAQGSRIILCHPTGNRLIVPAVSLYAGATPPSTMQHFLPAWSFSAAITTRGLAISSNIEPSWKKYIGSPSSLPNAYKLRDANGVLTNNINTDVAQLLGGNAPNLNNNVWRILNLRAPNGTMTVDSAATWFNTPNYPNTPFKAWLGSVVFTANAAGFYSPTSYTWTTPPSSTLSSSNAPNVRDYTAAPPSLSAPSTGINLGSAANGNGLTASSTATVTATDSNGSLTDTYTVNWHLPLERTGPTTELPMRTITTYVAPVDGNPSIQVQGEEFHNYTTGIGGVAGVASLLLPEYEAVIGAIIGAVEAFEDIAEEQWSSPATAYSTWDVQDYWVKNHDHDGLNGSTDWQDSDHFDQDSYDIIDNPDGWKYVKLGILKVHRFTRKTWPADVYKLHGFVTNGAEPFIDTNNHIYYEPKWEIDPTAGTPVWPPPTSP